MKRVFVDPQLLTKQWFQDFGTSEKMAFIAILLLCDDVGVWHINTKLVEFMVGSTVDWKRLEKCNGNLILLREGVLWIPDYCRFQYKHIEASSNAHESYRRIAEGHGILEEIRSTYKGSTLRLQLANSTPTLGLPLVKGTPTLKDKDKDKDLSSLSNPEENTRETLERVGYDFKLRQWTGIPDEMLVDWVQAFPRVKVEEELRRMGAWLDAHAKDPQWKGKDNWEVFVTGWLADRQEKREAAGGKR